MKELLEAWQEYTDFVNRYPDKYVPDNEKGKLMTFECFIKWVKEYKLEDSN